MSLKTALYGTFVKDIKTKLMVMAFFEGPVVALVWVFGGKSPLDAYWIKAGVTALLTASFIFSVWTDGVIDSGKADGEI